MKMKSWNFLMEIIIKCKFDIFKCQNRQKFTWEKNVVQSLIFFIKLTFITSPLTLSFAFHENDVYEQNFSFYFMNHKLHVIYFWQEVNFLWSRRMSRRS